MKPLIIVLIVVFSAASFGIDETQEKLPPKLIEKLVNTAKDYKKDFIKNYSDDKNYSKGIKQWVENIKKWESESSDSTVDSINSETNSLIKINKNCIVNWIIAHQLYKTTKNNEEFKTVKDFCSNYMLHNELDKYEKFKLCNLLLIYLDNNNNIPIPTELNEYLTTNNIISLTSLINERN